ncbi:hypothetical protein WCLP8_2710003 [uncultured Gammaproteobacteria bacterium]
MTSRPERGTRRSGLVLIASAVVMLSLGQPGLAAEGTGRADGSAHGGTVWEMVRDSTLEAVGYGAAVLHSVAAWLSDLGQGGGDRVDGAELRALIGLPEKNFREFESLILAAGFRLTAITLGTSEPPELDLSFAFARHPSDKERANLRAAIAARNGGLGSSLWRTVLNALLDATRYVDAIPASGYRLEGVSIRIGSASTVKVNFRRAGG